MATLEAAELTSSFKGRGVFAGAPIAARSIVDVCPVLVFPRGENREHIQRTILQHYTYTWPIPQPQGATPLRLDPSSHVQTQAVVLGLGSLFNHSSQQQNVGWTRQIDARTITYTALRDIVAGEELCISYGTRLTFDDVEAMASMSRGGNGHASPDDEMMFNIDQDLFRDSDPAPGRGASDT